MGGQRVSRSIWYRNLKNIFAENGHSVSGTKAFTFLVDAFSATDNFRR